MCPSIPRRTVEAITFGSGPEHVSIVLPPTFSAESWGQAEVAIAVAGFNGRIAPWVERVDFERFVPQLRALYDTLTGHAEFVPIDRQFTFVMKAAAGGHIELSGEAWSQATYENKLTFKLALDQSGQRQLSWPLDDNYPGRFEAGCSCR